MSRERLFVLQQRLSRNRLFSQPALNWKGATSRTYCELTLVQGLKGAAPGEVKCVPAPHLPKLSNFVVYVA